MKSLFNPTSPFRIFAFSALFSIAVILAIVSSLGLSALFITLVLVIVEITFSFENAIINAKILQHMSRFWQTIFLTVGIVIAIFGVRIILPIAIVSFTASIPWSEVIDLALHNPDEYAQKLESAAPSITAFGGAFLLMLSASFFFDKRRGVHWFGYIEEHMQRYGLSWVPLAISGTVIAVLSLLPINQHPKQTFIAGISGIVLYLFIHGLSELFSKAQKHRNNIKAQTGLVAFSSFLYLELLDASFSLDGVIGAFAITNQVILIAAGLGIGAIWVRSLTIFMVRRGTLKTYKYIEHGAFYTVSILAGILLLESVFHIPEAIAGILGVLIITSSVIASRKPVKA
jgi:hypothetical protein